METKGIAEALLFDLACFERPRGRWLHRGGCEVVQTMLINNVGQVRGPAASRPMASVAFRAG